MELDQICQNCGNFIQDCEDLRTDLGACILDDLFQPFLEEILENGDFSKCDEIYLKKRYDGNMLACSRYEQLEIIEISEDEYIDVNLYIEQMKHKNVDEIIKNCYDADKTIANNAISAISRYVYIGNESALEGLFNYYMNLDLAESIEDVNTRMKIIDILSSKGSNKIMIDAYVNELFRTPSNNTTRKLYTEILQRLSRCPAEMVEGPLLELLSKKKYSYKIKNRIMDTATRESDEYFQHRFL